MSLSRVGFLALAFFSIFLFSSCAPKLGWGLLLWSAPKAGLHAGAILPVYIKSNIEKLYVVGVPGGVKIEVPLWQIELFKSKAAAEKSLARFGTYVTSYLFANRDGLPIRESATNAGKRVYRLREGQSVKILAQVKGDVVTSGAEALEGSWFQVITEDGTRGFVFSNTMRLYDEIFEAPPTLAGASTIDPAHRVDLVFSRVWRAEYFQAMIDEGRVDLDLVSPRFGLFADALRRQLRIELPYVSQVFNYSTIAQSGDDVVFEGSPLRIRFDGEAKLIADWSGNSTAVSIPALVDTSSSTTTTTTTTVSSGSPDLSAQVPPAARSSSPVNPSAIPPPSSATQATFVVLGTDLRDAIRGEETRRLNLLSAFINSGSTWLLLPTSLPASVKDAASSSQAVGAKSPDSRLVFSRGGRFSWTGMDLVPPDYLPSDLGVLEEERSSGEATVRLGLDAALAANWEGALSIRFDATKNWLDLLYRHEGKTLVLLPVASGSTRNLTAMTASALAPLVFQAQ